MLPPVIVSGLGEGLLGKKTNLFCMNFGLAPKFNEMIHGTKSNEMRRAAKNQLHVASRYSQWFGRGPVREKNGLFVQIMT